MASQTVENYLKTIYLAQQGLREPHALVPMGQLSAALGVVPGTATAMVKALAESGLVRYEPYSGVRLTPAGEKLAALVLRRHRLIELFLVRVMGMNWTDVHAEAEQLEHVVSDRLIARIDEMLGHPDVDPHGDPIPGADGTVAAREDATLLTCPARTPVVVTRVLDQDAAFLRFVDHHDLKPGSTLEIEARDEAADAVHIRAGDRRLTLGARAAAKLLVRAAGLLLLVLGAAAVAWAQTSPAPASRRPFAILDNSFLVEEAFNQEPGVFQNIFTFVRQGGAWELAFTQEWPMGSVRDQFSYTVGLTGLPGAVSFGDTLLTYRRQLLTEGPGRPALAPRVSLILPTGRARQGLGRGAVGAQVNLPMSKQAGDVYWHANAGLTWLPGADAAVGVAPRAEADLLGAHAAASLIWRARPMLHLLVEVLAERDEAIVGPGRTEPVGSVTLSPGMRGGWNVAARQIVVGVALPTTLSRGAASAGVFLYGSYELPFRAAGPSSP